MNGECRDVSVLKIGLQTVQPIDTATHNIKKFQHLPVQTFQLIHFYFSTPISKTCQPIYRRRFNPWQTYFHR